MPKKFKGENSKAVVAKARKAAAAAEIKSQKEKEAEDLKWKEDDKNINKKFQRKEEREKKRLEDLQRKNENKLLAEQESQEIAPEINKPQKITVFELQQQKEKREKELKNSENKIVEEPLTENLNRLEGDIISGSGLDSALKAMTMADDTTQPRLSIAAAYKIFEENMMPKIKKENPKLKLSQQKDMLRKLWQRSPDNPLNSRS